MFSALVPEIGPISVEPDLIVIKQNFTIRVRVTEESSVLFYVKNYSGEISAGQKNYPMWGDETIRVAKHLVSFGILNSEKDELPEYIAEPVFYLLSMKAENETARAFQRTIAYDVLPSIRKHGAYITTDTLDKMIASPEFGIKLLTALKDEQRKRKALEEKVETDRPKVLFADSVAASKSSILVGEMAKLLKQNGVETGQNRFFEYLRQNGYLIRRQGNDYNMPTQKSMEMGLFEIKETVINHSDGHTSVNKTPKITGKGQQYFVNIFLGKNA